MRDDATGARRPSTKADVADSARLVDALPNVSYYWGPLITAEDKPQRTKYLHELEAIFSNTGKHVQAVDVVGERAGSPGHRDGRGGGRRLRELRRRPLL